MKFLNIDHWLADQKRKDAKEESPTVLALKEYQKYFEEIKEKIPHAYLKLVREIFLHDANLREIKFNASSSSLQLVLDASDITRREPKKIMLKYNQVKSFSSFSDPTKYLPGPGGYGDLGYEEFDVIEEGLFSHAMLFSSGIELIVAFRKFDFEV